MKGETVEAAAPVERGWFQRVGGAGAVLAGVLLSVGVVGLAMKSETFRPWLAVLLGVNAGLGDVSMSSLSMVNPVDIGMLVVSALAFAGFWPGPGRPRKAWMAVSTLLPVAGIGVLVATGLWGRSGLMGGGLVLSALMLGNRKLRPAAYTGFAANALLLVGDFATTGLRSTPVTLVVGIGYTLLVVWFAWIAVRLLAPEPVSASVLPT
jgi:hypothetical protein